MRDEEVNVDTSPSLIPLQTATAGELPQIPFTPPPGATFVGSLNAQTGNVLFVPGTSGFTLPSGGGVITLTGPLTTKGDLYTRDGSAGTRLGVGSNGQVLTADSAQATGIKWATITTGVSSVTGTANQVTASPTTGAVVLTTPQDIHTGASPTFAKATLGGLRIMGFTSSAADPTTTELPNNQDCSIHKNTTSTNVFLAFNDSGTIRKVQLT